MVRDFSQIANDEFFRRFFDFWQHARNGDGLPTRKDIKLEDFAGFVPRLTIFELQAPDVLRFRLVGSSVSERAKTFRPDINLFDFVVADMRADVQTWCGNIFSTPCAGIEQVSIGYPDGSSRIARVMSLPVQHTVNTIYCLTLSMLSDRYEACEPRDELIIARDCFQAEYIDIEFGLPKNVPVRQDHKVLDDTFGNRIFID